MKASGQRRVIADTGSLPLAMLLVIVGSGLAAILAPVVLGQLTATRTEFRRLQALNAAHTGLEAGVARIRAAADATGAGDVTKLPCAASGAVGGVSTGRYTAQISYRTAKSATSAMACPMPAGSRPPRFAEIVSIGSDAPAGVTRQLRATYTFANALTGNNPGGLIRVYGTDSCLDAGSADPLVNTAVAVTGCEPGSGRQQFVYNAMLNLVMVTPSHPNGLCLDAPSTAGVVVRLKACQRPAVPAQRWSFNDTRNFEATGDGVTLNGFCFNSQGGMLVMAEATYAGGRPAPGTPCLELAFNSVQSFAPESAVGAGAAGPRNNQIVNYGEFGRCLDMDSFRPDSLLIVYPCKQAPDPSQVGWNQRWRLPAGGTGMIYLVDPDTGTRHCLTPPPAGAGDLRLGLSPCPAGAPPSSLVWTVYGRTASLTQSYRIEDHLGRCLASSDQVRYVNLANWAVVADCDSSKIQKWNAEPIRLADALTDIAER